MAYLINIKFPDGAVGVGPLKLDQPTPEDLSSWHRYETITTRRKMIVYSDTPLNDANKAIAEKWALDQEKKD